MTNSVIIKTMKPARSLMENKKEKPKKICCAIYRLRRRPSRSRCLKNPPKDGG